MTDDTRESDPPQWFEWALELSPHVLKRMVDRDFNEADLRTMIQDHRKIVADAEPGRWVIHTQSNRHPWHVIVEPDAAFERLVVVTAYKLE